MDSSPSASIIIPAHNEARVITRTLQTLTATSDKGEFDIVVVCNGCNDETQSVASSFGHPDVRVLAIDAPSKSRAMSHGDSAAYAFPRLYLDADVELSTDGARAMVQALHTAPSVVASPQYRIEGCTSLASAYWQEWRRRNPRPRAGTGCFGLSEAARSGFGDFPDVLGDDLWVAATFEPEVVEAAETQVRVARTIPSVFERRVRIARGNREGASQAARTTARRTRAANQAAPLGISSLGVALLASVHVTAAAWARIPGTGSWVQDRSSR